MCVDWDSVTCHFKHYHDMQHEHVSAMSRSNVYMQRLHIKINRVSTHGEFKHIKIRGLLYCCVKIEIDGNWSCAFTVYLVDVLVLLCECIGTLIVVLNRQGEIHGCCGIFE